DPIVRSPWLHGVVTLDGFNPGVVARFVDDDARSFVFAGAFDHGLYGADCLSVFWYLRATLRTLISCVVQGRCNGDLFVIWHTVYFDFIEQFRASCCTCL